MYGNQMTLEAMVQLCVKQKLEEARLARRALTVWRGPRVDRRPTAKV